MSVQPGFAKKAWLIGGVAVFLTLVLTVFMMTRDIGPIDDSDLALPARAVDPDENPFPALRDVEIDEEETVRIGLVARLLRMDPADPQYQGYLDRLFDGLEMAPVTAPAEIEVLLVRKGAELVGKNRESLSRFRRYAGMTGWLETAEIDYNSDLTFLTAWNRVAQLQSIEIELLLREGKTDEAIGRAIDLVRFGAGLQDAHGALIHFLVGITMVKMGHVAVVRIIDHGNPDAGKLEELSKALESVEFDHDGIRNALLAEYRSGCVIIDELSTGEIDLSEFTSGIAGSAPAAGGRIPSALVFKRNKTRKLFAEAFRTMLSEVGMTRKDAPRASQLLAEEAARNRFGNILSGNVVGHILFSISIPAVDSVLDNSAQQIANHGLVRVRVALERLRLEKGTWPGDLEELVPKYIDAVPVDPMDGEPLRYDPESKVLYSVGRDFKDNGGVSPRGRKGQLADRDEVIIRLERDKTNAP